MKILGMKIAERFRKDHSTSRAALDNWIKVTTEANWNSPVDTKNTWNSADVIAGNIYCFDLGIHFRLEATISFKQQALTITRIETHAEYSQRMRRR